MKTRLLLFALLGALLIGTVFIWNHLSLQAPMSQVLLSDSRNSGIQAKAHYKSYVRPSVLVYDLREVAGDKSPTDVFRVLLQYAQAVEHRQFTTVELAFRGKTKFLLEGTYFRKLGREYESQNPVFTMRTLPENLLLPDGTRAYSAWEGGWLGVLNEQLEDFNDFHSKWYLEESL